ncbi:hypothetical protein TPHA_0L01480 [Tetrapisispora phaffii CBS 4417]|uniref:Uncharacterized protein n=1 Tax=Tetrapisispora phaffii (strain ATCC 24235 / CBS 4417 / NBRC 1672 / NRRL Y-8282 / UCD 70-5) TaxID=1071381 RepID=G8C025_TETPH|nr:hypothetical protein TPHA_0L01480 [Tetrapisispora phaffii CBS 4417]CCE65503.1 hypothetical protein TPHA_0L01480 [Tetrapisispora phaffii CBS 4417]
MRKELKIFMYANIFLFLLAIYVTFDLLTMAVDDTLKDAITEYEINHPATDAKDNLIPKIIHQTYKTEDIPEHWKEGQSKCKYLHSDYKYMFWTDKNSLEFIEEHYPWFAKSFKAYKFPIERADVIRYFILDYYGGIYIDLDDACERKLDPLLQFPAFVRKTSPTGISNDVMGSKPHHPFFIRLQKNLDKYNRNIHIPYFTILASTGPLFVSLIWKQYKRWGVTPGDEIRILQPEYYKMHSYSFFSITKGSSWHTEDATFIKSLASHILACVVAGFVFAFSMLYLEYCFYAWLCSRNDKSSTKTRSYMSFKFMMLPIHKVLGVFYNFRKDEFQMSDNIRLQTLPKENKYAGSSKKATNLKKKRKDSNVSYMHLINDLESNLETV